MALTVRVARLEHRAKSAFACPDCGGGGDDERAGSRCQVEWLALDEAGAEPETCPACGQESVILVWED